jgi:hypothetical protein
MEQSLFQILSDLASFQPKLVLMQGRSYWSIQDLYRQAREDMKDAGHRKALSAELYSRSEVDGKVIVWKSGLPVFVEPGSDLKTTV